MFKAVTITLLTIAGGLLAVSAQQQDVIEEDTSKFMNRKLDYSREIVEGLTTENYKQITKAAQDMMLLSHEADWNVATSPQYLKASSDFRDTVSRLRDAGDSKNLDGATIAYFEVTLNCVRCHKQLRKPIRSKFLNQK